MSQKEIISSSKWSEETVDLSSLDEETVDITSFEDTEVNDKGDKCQESDCHKLIDVVVLRTNSVGANVEEYYCLSHGTARFMKNSKYKTIKRL